MITNNGYIKMFLDGFILSAVNRCMHVLLLYMLLSPPWVFPDSLCEPVSCANVFVSLTCDSICAHLALST